MDFLNRSSMDDSRRIMDMTITAQPTTAQTGDPLPFTVFGQQFLHGLDFLAAIPSISIEQILEDNSSIFKKESQNRYVIELSNEKYTANELSSPIQRLLCCSRRSFSLTLSDQQRNEKVVFRRRLAANSCCFPCRLQNINVLELPGKLLGGVQQQWTLNTPLFHAIDTENEMLFIIKGTPMSFFCRPLEAQFQIINRDGLVLGIISHRLDTRTNKYIMAIDFSIPSVDTKLKALILGAAFLLEYTYFIGPKSKKFTQWFC